MKHICCKKGNKTAAFFIFSLIFAILAAVSVYCIHRFLLDDQKDYDYDDEDEDYIDENGVCYTDERNFVD